MSLTRKSFALVLSFFVTPSPKWKKSVSLVLISALIVSTLASCAYHYEGIRSLDNIQNNLEPGDIVRIVTKDGRDFNFKIKAITSEAIVGERQRVYFSEISTLEKFELNAIASKLEKLEPGASEITGAIKNVVGAMAATVVIVHYVLLSAGVVLLLFYL